LKPILEIKIPTYNRLEKLKATLSQFNLIAHLVRSGRVQIVVFDNSDKDNSYQLGTEILSFVEYNWNGGNIGYHGNICKCFSRRHGVFSWIIADDDKLSVLEIPELINYLEHYKADIAGLALPYEVNVLSESDIQKDISVKPAFGKIVRFGDIIIPQSITFDFLSRFIIKTDLLNRTDLNRFLTKNDYFHSLVYCSSLHLDDLIGIYENAIISYILPSSMNWSLESLIKSKYEICDTLADKNLIQMDKSTILSEILKWAIFGRIGVTKVQELELELSTLVQFALRDRSVKNLLLATLLVVPCTVARELTIIALAIKSDRNTSKSLVQRLKSIRREIKFRANS
jgi:hypothetical protein